ncbi:MAG TPA: tetratricopeptide repeat protein [Candidatus Eisenbacteria bacterium]|nr:tetratricopeptide repeat protein [Candidatus Eisenbacteria bacterium]
MLRRVSLALAIAALSAAPAQAQHNHHTAPSSGSAAPLLEGLGSVHREIKTSAPLAQKYFDQGLRLAYGFNHEEAKRAFLEAARLDSTCAMAWWGAALVLGPNINLPMSPEAETEAYRYAQRALACKDAPPLERAMVEAVAKRYDATAGMNRAAHDSAYADAMRAIHKEHPADPDIATLTAESLMDLRPWDYWAMDGKAQPGTMEIVSILEGVLKAHPDHIGAIHLYIHAVEESPEPGRAEKYADKLAKLAPNAGHLVHMPSHIHLRVGRYADAVDYNAKAIAADRAYIGKYNPPGVYPIMYYPHNIHMRWSALLSSGRRADALQAARDLATAVPDSIVVAMPMAEFFRVAPYLTQARFGLWEEALNEPAPKTGMPFQRGAWHYARGMAYAAGGKYAEAQAERDSVAAVASSLTPDVYFGLNPAAPVFRFAAAHLAGEIALRRGNNDEAIQLLSTAAGLQDSLHYDEPPAWQQTARQSLGAALLAAGRSADAEAVYREDLARYPETGWSLYGLTQALRAEGKTKEAAEAEKRFRRAWAKSDTKLVASRF